MQRLAKRVEAFINSDDVGCEWGRLLHIQREEVRPFLISDQKQIFETCRDQQGDFGPFFLEQRICATGGGQMHGERRQWFGCNRAGGQSRRENRGLHVKHDLDRLVKRCLIRKRLGQA